MTRQESDRLYLKNSPDCVVDQPCHEFNCSCGPHTCTHQKKRERERKRLCSANVALSFEKPRAIEFCEFKLDSNRGQNSRGTISEREYTKTGRNCLTILFLYVYTDVCVFIYTLKNSYTFFSLYISSPNFI